MKMRPTLSISKRILATAILGVAVLCTMLGVNPAVASVTEGKAALRDGDFITAAREFQGPAYKGDRVAQYYLGVLFADGRGVRQSRVDGLAWFICAQTGPLPAPLDSDVKQRRAQLISTISPNGFDRSENLAQTLCGAASSREQRSEQGGYFEVEKIRPIRGKFGSWLFFPGDTMVIGALVIFHENALFTLRDVLALIARGFGDVLFGLCALLGWIIFGRGVYYILSFVFAHVTSGRRLVKRGVAEETGTGGTLEANESIGP